MNDCTANKNNNQTVQKEYVSHIREDGTRETVATHLDEVGRMAADFATPFGLDIWAQFAGRIHDLGKYSDEFQHRILDQGPRVDHATAGAFEAAKANLWPISYAVSGHHGGLPNGGVTGDLPDAGTLAGRMLKAAKGLTPDYSAYRDDLSGLPDIEQLAKCGTNEPNLLDRINGSGEDDPCFSVQFLIRMLFSCLVDADFLCTERFMKNGHLRETPSTASISGLCESLERTIARFYPPHTSLNQKRCEVLDDCLRAAREEPGVFSLTVPTGGGKTYAAMRFALNHARQHGMRRVIVAEPYTSIIEQNAQVYRDALGIDNVLEHHADFDFEAPYTRVNDMTGDADAATKAAQMRLAAENWDMPIVVTTNVRLFESVFANRTSACRKLHNIAGSVIVLDEAQTIPTDYLIPCIRVLVELVRFYGCSVVLCTATQPALDGYFNGYDMPVREIVRDTSSLFSALRRVMYEYIGSVSNTELAQRIVSDEQCLCVVNNRQQAHDLYQLVASCSGDGEAFHLSTLMFPVHRQRTLRTIRKQLRGGEPCRVIATSLVEAGVDLDFPVVYRALAGLDSIIQAAGRCNREASSSELGHVYIFENAVDHMKVSEMDDCSEGSREDNPSVVHYAAPREVSMRAGVTVTAFPQVRSEGVLANLDSQSSIATYYRLLYFGKGKDALDKQSILASLSEISTAIVALAHEQSLAIGSIPFADVAERFRFIAEDSYQVVIPQEEVSQEVTALRESFATRDVLRALGRYCVSVYQRDLKTLKAAGAVMPTVSEGLFILKDCSLYTADTGLNTTPEQGQGIVW